MAVFLCNKKARLVLAFFLFFLFQNPYLLQVPGRNDTSWKSNDCDTDKVGKNGEEPSCSGDRRDITISDRRQ